MPPILPPDPAPSERLREDYLSHLRVERRLSLHTEKGYARDLVLLLQLAGKQSLGTLSSHDIRRYISTLHGRGLSGRSLGRALSAWRGFFDFLARDHGFQHNPCADVRPPKSPKKLPHALTPDAAAQLMRLSGEGFLALRDHAMLELFYSSGLRLSELAGLDVPDVNRTDHTVIVTGKGSKTRLIPVGQKALEALQLWLQYRASVAGDHSALFVTQTGKRLSGRSIEARVSLRAQQLGLADRVHPHVLRHSFASHVLQSSGDLRAVQDMLGHASITSTQVYTHLDFQHLARIYDAAHPRARRKG
ncbi:MAG: tyrosine recombinase XerC [Betaproteobacteria bacterium]|nr:tyrosine recombinase XerC [Betaproteobacteria bacterium]